MFCKNCGTKLEEGVKFCPSCGAATTPENSQPAATVVNPIPQTENMGAVNSLVGKEYTFSGNDLVARGWYKVICNVKVGEDRLNIETIPEKKNKIPVVMLNDITGIEECFHMRTGNIILGAFGLLFGLIGLFSDSDFSFAPFILPIAVGIFYRERKIKIHLRNGSTLTIYSADKSDAVAFVNDMKRITNIR